MSALSIAMELPAHDVFNMEIVLEPARRLCLIAWRIGVFMGQVLQFSRRDKTFDAETTAVLISAYEKATAAIEKSGQPCIMHEVAARRIIAMASKGERNPDRLCAAALATVAKSAPQRPRPPIRLSPALVVVDASDRRWSDRPSDLVAD